MNKPLLSAFLCMSLFLVIGVSPVNALLIGGDDIITAPSSVIDDFPGAENHHQQAFNEAQDVLLTRDIAVDGGTLAAGLWVDSHMIFLNTPTSAYEDDIRTWSFDAPIIGVMSDRNGLLEAAGSDLLGAPGTIYPGSFSARGMEGSDWYHAFGSTIDVYMLVTEPGDWIRVITGHESKPVSEPATMLLLGTGIVGLVGLSRKKLIK